MGRVGKGGMLRLMVGLQNHRRILKDVQKEVLRRGRKERLKGWVGGEVGLEAQQGRPSLAGSVHSYSMPWSIEAGGNDVIDINDVDTDNV
jgi:hypothetical protein